MLEALAEALQASALSRSLAASVWLYPLVNAAHIVGIALLFGAIVPLDLRLAGCWKTVRVASLSRVLVPVSAAGLVLAAGTGALLFATRPLDYLREPLFALKLGLIALALVNAWWLRRSAPWRARERSGGTTPGWRLAGAASMLLWLAAITVGRLIGYR